MSARVAPRQASAAARLTKLEFIAKSACCGTVVSIRQATDASGLAKSKIRKISGALQFVSIFEGIELAVEIIDFTHELRFGIVTGLGIQGEFLGKGARYEEIVEANREVIKDADKIYPGQKIRIPMD